MWLTHRPRDGNENARLTRKPKAEQAMFDTAKRVIL